MSIHTSTSLFITEAPNVGSGASPNNAWITITAGTATINIHFDTADQVHQLCRSIENAGFDALTKRDETS